MIDLEGMTVDKIDIISVKTRTLKNTNRSKSAGI